MGRWRCLSAPYGSYLSFTKYFPINGIGILLCPCVTAFVCSLFSHANPQRLLFQDWGALQASFGWWSKQSMLCMICRLLTYDLLNQLRLSIWSLNVIRRSVLRKRFSCCDWQEMKVFRSSKMSLSTLLMIPSERTGPKEVRRLSALAQDLAK